MYREFPMPELATREKNFFNSALPSTIDGKKWYMDLQWLAGDITIAATKMQGTYSEKEILRTVLIHVYDFVMGHNENYRIFNNDSFPNGDEAKGSEGSIADNIFETCFFMSLCMFLYDTKRIKGMSLRKFIYEHSPIKYNVKGSVHYFDISLNGRRYKNRNYDKSQINSDDALLRKYRERLLSTRPVHHHSPEWSAIRKSSEYEWELYFILDGIDVDSKIRDTAKRIRTLYNGIHEAFKSEKDEKYLERLDNAGNKFCAKLSKIQYGGFLDLGKFCLAHIEKDKTYYGINLYRFEKEIRLYRITSDVNRLLNCDEEAETERIIDLAIRMNDIIFPQLYEYFKSLPDVRHIQFYADTFGSFMDEVVRSSRLIIDKFVEDGIFGEDWEELFLKTTNELAEVVLYNPLEIDYSLTPESQREFQIYLLEPVDRQIAYQKWLFNAHRSLSSEFLGLEKDDEI